MLVRVAVRHTSRRIPVLQATLPEVRVRDFGVVEDCGAAPERRVLQCAVVDAQGGAAGKHVFEGGTLFKDPLPAAQRAVG